MMPFVPFTILNLAVFRLSEKISTDRQKNFHGQTDRQTDKPSYRSSSPKLKNFGPIMWVDRKIVLMSLLAPAEADLISTP